MGMVDCMRQANDLSLLLVDALCLKIQFSLKIIMHYITFGKEALLITHSSKSNISLSLNYREHSIREVSPSPSKNTIGFYCLMGLKHIQEEAFLLVGDRVQEVTSIGLSKIYEIKSTRWIAVGPFQQQNNLVEANAEELQILSTIFQDGNHYYSQNYDLSTTYLFNRIRQPDPAIRQYYDQFIWNDNLSSMDGGQNQKEVEMFRRWCCRVIQGYVQEYSGPFCNGGIIRYLIISRKSHRKAGTRFYARGIDDEGNVANFVQTEQIAMVDDFIFTHLQIRGSVPAFFSQIGINGISGETVIERASELTKGAFERHFVKLRQVYGGIVAINLLSQKKSEQKCLTDFFEGMVNDYANPTALKYHFFDFHQQCKSDNFANTQNLMEQVQQQISRMMFDCYRVSSGQFLCRQSGVFRTNCLDCLDRTNYVQSRLALRHFKLFLGRFGDGLTMKLVLNRQLLDLPVNENYPILKGFNSAWADNGEALSLLYTGIGSTHTDITRTGERNFLGTVNHKFKSLRRFYAQFGDESKHGAITKLVSPSSSRVSLRSGGSSFQTALLFSFVLSQDRQQALRSMKQQIEQVDSKLVVCFVYQQFEDNFFNKIKEVFTNYKGQIAQWQDAVSGAAASWKYLKVASLSDKHSWLGVFCLEQASSRLSQIKSEILTEEISFGDALLVKMKLQDSSFIFAGVNCPDFDSFLTSFDEIHEKGFQISKLGLFKSSSFMQLDYRVILGNTGSKILMKPAESADLQSQLQRSSLKEDKSQVIGVISKILDCDQLNQSSSRGRTKFLREYSEGSLQFVPSSNRMLFWNEQRAVLKIRDYRQIGERSIGATLDYEISRGGGK